jgi:hypothetical protein
MGSSNELAVKTDDEGNLESGPVLHLAATLLAFGATSIVRRAMDAGYKRATGRLTPSPTDGTSGILTTVAWAALTAATAAVVEVAILRTLEGSRHRR